jgi:hypothetical protein
MAGFYVHGDDPGDFIQIGKFLTNCITTPAQQRSYTFFVTGIVQYELCVNLWVKERQFERLGVGL